MYNKVEIFSNLSDYKIIKSNYQVPTVKESPQLYIKLQTRARMAWI